MGQPKELIAPRIEMSTVRNGYLDLCGLLRDCGRLVTPRGLPCRELTGAVVVVDEPDHDSVPVGIGRDLHLGIASVEAAHLVAGLSDGLQVMSVSSNFKAFSDDGVSFFGAYGPRIYYQLDHVVRTLANDPDSRQAVAVVWNGTELEAPTKDLPCTLHFQFLIRDEALEMITSMRSNDVWLGVPYDFAMFICLQRTLAWALGVEVGPYTHQVGSLHLYERNVVEVDKLIVGHDEAGDVVPPFAPIGADTRPGRRSEEAAIARLNKARLWARAVALDLQLAVSTPVPERVEATHGRRLRPHASGGLLCSICRYVWPRTTEYFYAARLHDGERSQCKRCVHVRVRERFSSEDAQLERRLRPYGVTVDWYRARVEAQDGRCAICDRPPDNGRWRGLVVDHDHETGEARGLVCSNCNHGLGMFGDDADRIERALRYLRG